MTPQEIHDRQLAWVRLSLSLSPVRADRQFEMIAYAQERANLAIVRGQGR